MSTNVPKVLTTCYRIFAKPPGLCSYGPCSNELPKVRRIASEESVVLDKTQENKKKCLKLLAILNRFSRNGIVH